jgi:formylglycine-generating enzyme required for sulfatase activity
LCDPGRDVCRLDWFSDALPVHQVALDDFWIDQHEVTNAQYARCVRARGCQPPEKSSLYTNDAYYGNPAYDSYPVLHVSWEQASAYCAWVGAELPTEAQWEYTARGPLSSRFPWGDEFDGTRLNYCDASCWLSWRDDATDDGYPETAPVGIYPEGASWCGALDMAGNVWEWVADWHAEDYTQEASARNPAGPDTGEQRVLRGGSWGVEPIYNAATYRWHAYPDRTKIYWGFRCAKSVQ